MFREKKIKEKKKIPANSQSCVKISNIIKIYNLQKKKIFSAMSKDF